jgi:hypothetical protein
MTRCTDCQLGQGRQCRCARPLSPRAAALVLLGLNAALWAAFVAAGAMLLEAL